MKNTKQKHTTRQRHEEKEKKRPSVDRIYAVLDRFVQKEDPQRRYHWSLLGDYLEVCTGESIDDEDLFVPKLQQWLEAKYGK